MHFFVKVKKDKKKEKKAKEDVVAAESMKKRKKDKVGFSCPVHHATSTMHIYITVPDVVPDSGYQSRYQ